MITREDEFPFKNNIDLKKFIKNSYNKKLGWDRKKNSFGYETLLNRKTKFTITKYGFRKSRYKNQNSTISVFGDSYAFCRYVNDDKTWESYLERKIKKSVRNYGVGNFGIDQSYLKFKQTKLSKNTKLILFAFVPETISRINSFWKHYSEF